MKVGTALAAALANSRTVVMPGAGYMMMVDAGVASFLVRGRAKCHYLNPGSMLWRLQEWLSPAHYVRASSRAKTSFAGGSFNASIAASQGTTVWMISSLSFRCDSRSSTFGISAWMLAHPIVKRTPWRYIASSGTGAGP